MLRVRRPLLAGLPSIQLSSVREIEPSPDLNRQPKGLFAPNGRFGLKAKTEFDSPIRQGRFMALYQYPRKSRRLHMSTVRPEKTGRKPRSTPSGSKRKSGPPTEAPDAQEATAGSDDSPAFIYPGHLIRGPPLAFSIREFCLAHRISVPFLFSIKGTGPRAT